jgi:hypothetical protein
MRYTIVSAARDVGILCRTAKPNAEGLLWKPRFSSGHKVHPHKAFGYRSPHEFIAGGPDADRSSSACISMQTMGASGEPLSVTSLEVTVHALVPVAPSLPPAKMTDRAPPPFDLPNKTPPLLSISPQLILHHFARDLNRLGKPK